MLRRKTNRRRVERKAPRFKWPAVSMPWLGKLRAVAVVGIALGGSFGVIEAGALALDHPVRKLVVEGTFQRVTPLQVEAAVREGLEDGFLTVDLGAVRERVKALDWVDQVNVGRSWPDTLVVRVTEHQAAARWGEHGLLNVRGELFTENSQYGFPELPSLGGPDGSERDVARRYLAVRGRLAEAELSLKSLVMDERGAWRLVLGSGQEIRLGRRDIDDRLLRFFDVVAPALAGDLKRAAYVDLRYTNGFAVGWREAASGDSALLARAGERG